MSHLSSTTIIFPATLCMFSARLVPHFIFCFLLCAYTCDFHLNDEGILAVFVQSSTSSIRCFSPWRTFCSYPSANNDLADSTICQFCHPDHHSNTETFTPGYVILHSFFCIPRSENIRHLSKPLLPAVSFPRVPIDKSQLWHRPATCMGDVPAWHVSYVIILGHLLTYTFYLTYHKQRKEGV